MNKASYVFVDTSFLKAILDIKDEFHINSKKIFKRLQEEEETLLITSNYVLDESFTLLRKRCGLEAAIQLRDDLVRSSKAIKLIRITSADDARAWDWFLNDWSDLSFTDCVSFALMNRLSIKRSATFDRHFQRAGFEIEKV
ncbi:PIN domain-containing protein [Candidatus Microgenomates bacterium]|nr:PIN domain-containing protein [Candidatus Microgenomates bacterium]